MGKHQLITAADVHRLYSLGNVCNNLHSGSIMTSDCLEGLDFSAVHNLLMNLVLDTHYMHIYGWCD